MRILILGGGYVAIWATRALRGAIRRGEAEVTVVSRHNYHVFHGFVGEMLTGRIGPGQILSPARRIFSPAKVHVAEIESIDFESHLVVTSSLLDGRQHELPYDHLVLALGSVDDVAAYPGLEEHAFKLKTYDDCFRLKNHILTMFELAEIETDPEERRRLLTFFIAGGGYAGAEIAGELGHYASLLAERLYPDVKQADCRVILVHPGATILPELHGGAGAAGYGGGHPKLVEYATKHLQKLGVEIMTNTKVSWVSGVDVGLSHGEVVPTRTVISAVGIKAQPIIGALPLEKDPRDRLKTDAALRVPGLENVWSAGDCAAVPHPKGGLCPPVGIYALQEGRHVAQNILRVCAGQEPKPFAYPGLGQAVSIGNRTAVGELRLVPFAFTGFIAWALWRAFLFRYLPSWEKRLRLLADWLLWPIIGREVVEMSVADAHNFHIRHALFEPGEVIVSAGQVGQDVYLVLDGEVEVSRGSESPDDLTILGPGSHFGQRHKNRKSRETVRARSAVRLAVLRADQRKRLATELASLIQASPDPEDLQPVE